MQTLAQFLREFDFPGLKMDQQRGGMFLTFQASGKQKFALDEAILAQV